MAGAAFWGLNDAGGSCAEGSLYASDVWDNFIVAGMALPGICELRGVGPVFDMIVKKRKGANGARITYGGYDPKQFEVACEIGTPDQWDVFQDVCDVILRLKRTAPTGKDFVFDVRHPDLARMQIDQATVVGMPPGARGSYEGGKVFVIKFQEYFPDQGINVTKSATSSVSVHKDLQSHIKGREPANSAPPPPSSQKKNLRLQGPPPQAPEGA
ncbi:MAG: hypothetical protein V4537_14480 [Pseudomonadota bacterium]